MKKSEISRFTGPTTGNQVAITATALRQLNEEAMRAFTRRETVSATYDPEREFKLFTLVTLDPGCVVTIDSDLIPPTIDPAETSQEIHPEQTHQKADNSAGFVAYKANLTEIVRPNGAFGRFAIGSQESMTIVKVPPMSIPHALRVLPKVRLPIRAIVCDAVDGLEFWVEIHGVPGSPNYDAMDDMAWTLRNLHAKRIPCDPHSPWLIPGSFPLHPSNPKSLRRRLMYACYYPSSQGMVDSINLLSGELHC
jgi:hypothetical protein